jgi:hypothetical protein
MLIGCALKSMQHPDREQRIERAWRILRLTSVFASAVIIIVLVAIDFTYRFASWQLNVVIALVSVWLFILLKLDFWLHQLVRRVRRFR